MKLLRKLKIILNRAHVKWQRKFQRKQKKLLSKQGNEIMNNNEDKIINKDKIIIDGEGKILNASEATVIDRNKATVLKEKNFNGGRIVYYILGLLEVILGFRLVFKLLGANPGSGFVSFIYSISEIFLVPFNAIFRSASTRGIETEALLEPSTIIAMVVYALIAWGIVKLMAIMMGRNDSEM